MKADESMGRLRIFYWDDLGYTVRFSVDNGVDVHFDAYRVADKQPMMEGGQDAFIEKQVRMYRRAGHNDKFVQIDKIHEAQVFVSGLVSENGFSKYEFDSGGLNPYFKDKDKVQKLGVLVNRIYDTAQDLLKH